MQSVETELLQTHRVGQDLEYKICNRSARLGVIGLGYVGLPLATEMAKAGFHATGIDLDRRKVESINAGISPVPDVTNDTLFPLVAAGKIVATQSLAAVENLDAISVCVPTPLRKTKDPDLSYVIAAFEAIHNHLKPDQLIILESTTYPGTTRELVLPILERSGMEVGKDFFLAFSPERIDPGNKQYTTRNIPKVIGGMTRRCTELAVLLYQNFVETMVPVASPETAEMVKLLENTFRSVNIALANEMALVCHTLGINVWDVIEAAQTKPFGFMPFYPGPGLGGHCIPVDPHYLTWKARMNGVEPRLIELAGQINSEMPGFVIRRVTDALNEKQKSLNGSRVLAVGVTYKRDASDLRESPALDVVRGLRQKGAIVCYTDPYVPSLQIDGSIIESVKLAPKTLESMDCLVLLTDHSDFNYEMIVNHSPLVVDSRNALKSFSGPHIVNL